MKTCMMHACLGAALAVVVVVAAGCGKGGSSERGAPAASAVAVPGEAQTIAITGTAPSAAASASALAAPAPATSTSASAAPAGKPAGSAKAATASAAAAALAPAKEAAPLKPASTRVSGKNFVLDAASPGCRVDTPCAVTLRLAASGEYHVNKEYPYKFIAEAAPGVQFLGNGDANTFSRAAGDLREDSEKTATLTVRFKPSSAGEARVSGTYKMSVCSAENCQVETQQVTLAVPVL